MSGNGLGASLNGLSGTHRLVTRYLHDEHAQRNNERNIDSAVAHAAERGIPWMDHMVQQRLWMIDSEPQRSDGRRTHNSEAGAVRWLRCYG